MDKRQYNMSKDIEAWINIFFFFFNFLTFISLLNYIEIFQRIETLLGVEYIYIYIYRSKEGKGWGRIYKRKYN